MGTDWTYRVMHWQKKIAPVIVIIIIIIIHKLLQSTKNKVHLKTGGLFLFQNCADICNLLNVSRG
jgi:hypothetical protein